MLEGQSGAERFRREYGELFAGKSSDKNPLPAVVVGEQQWSLPPAGEYRGRNILRGKRSDSPTAMDKREVFRIRTGEASAGGSGRDRRVYHIASLGADEVGRLRAERSALEQYSRGRSLDGGGMMGRIPDTIQENTSSRIPSAAGRRLRLGQIAHGQMVHMMQSMTPAGKASPQHPRNTYIGLINQSLDSTPLPSFAPRKKPHTRKEELYSNPVRDIFKVDANVPNVNLKGINQIPAHEIFESHPKLLGHYLRHREPHGTYNVEEENREKQIQQEFQKKKSLERLTSKMAVLAEPNSSYTKQLLRQNSSMTRNQSSNLEPLAANPRQTKYVSPNFEQQENNQIGSIPFKDNNLEISVSKHAAVGTSPAATLQQMVLTAFEKIRTGRRLDKSRVVATL